VVDLLVKQDISELVIGYNKEWKQNVSIGKKNNQNFCSIPHQRFIEQLKYKCLLKGINVLINEESYTSKCSALDKETIKFHENYVGERVYRGLFKSKEGKYLNADINGSLNIGRKVFGDSYVDEHLCSLDNYLTDRGYVYYPIKVNL
jgi:IS605 OrfB family transposase